MSGRKLVTTTLELCAILCLTAAGWLLHPVVGLVVLGIALLIVAYAVGAGR